MHFQEFQASFPENSYNLLSHIEHQHYLKDNDINSLSGLCAFNFQANHINTYYQAILMKFNDKKWHGFFEDYVSGVFLFDELPKQNVIDQLFRSNLNTFVDLPIQLWIKSNAKGLNQEHKEYDLQIFPSGFDIANFLKETNSAHRKQYEQLKKDDRRKHPLKSVFGAIFKKPEVEYNSESELMKNSLAFFSQGFEASLFSEYVTVTNINEDLLRKYILEKEQDLLNKDNKNHTTSKIKVL